MAKRLIAGCCAVLAAGLGACGDRADENTGDTRATTLTVYASLPFQGPDGPESQAVANGARLALRQAGGKAGELVVKLAVLDDSTTDAGRWTPERTAENARIAVRDRTAIAYLGDGPSGATAISLPILNAAGIAQVSPTSGYQGLTTAQDAEKGEPEKYYPSGVRSFARPVPDDGVQAQAMIASLRAASCTRLRVLEDRDASGRGLTAAVERLAPGAGLELLGRETIRDGAEVADVTDDAAAVARDADCVLYTGALADWVPALFDALHAVDPRIELFAGERLASDAFAAALAAGTQARTHLTAPPGVLEPVAGVRAFVRDYRETFGVEARTGAVYGHAAMALVLAAIERAGALGNDRTAVIRELLTPGTIESALGPLRIDADGDTTSTAYTRLDVRDGALVRRRTVAFPAR